MGRTDRCGGPWPLRDAGAFPAPPGRYQAGRPHPLAMERLPDAVLEDARSQWDAAPTGWHRCSAPAGRS